MNLVLLLPEDLVAPDRACLRGRRLAHVREVHRAKVGDDLAVGLLDAHMGKGRVLRLDDEALELALTLEQAPPPKLHLTLVIALPRPKVLSRTLAAATSLGVARIVLVNAWRVEKAYWHSDRLAPETKTKLDEAVERARKALRGEDLAEIKAASDDLSRIYSEAGASLYAQAGATEGAAAPASEPTADTTAKAEDVVEADYEIVDEKK